MRECSVQGCTKSISGRFASMCTQHRQRKRRHGDPQQESISDTDIKPYVEKVEKLTERDKSGKIQAGLERIVSLLRDETEGTVSDYEHGRPMNKHRVQASKELLTVFRDFTPVQCAAVVAGMFLFLEENPSRFASDKGFTFEMVRRFRSISDANIGLYENPDTGNIRRAYKEIPPRTIEQLGMLLIDGFKTFVAHVRLHERKKAERAKEAKNLMEEGFAGMEAEEISSLQRTQ